MKKNLTCIVCPRGCTLSADINNGGITVSGYSCPKGKQYAEDECIAPKRTVTSSVNVLNRSSTMVSVKTEKPVPKEKIFDVMKIIRSKKAIAPVKIGDIIIKDVCGTDLIATKNID